MPLPQKQNSLRIGAAYVRVSTDGQMDLSPESQLDAIIKYAKANGIMIPKEYIFMESEGRSGKKADNRPQFQKMIATAKSIPKPFDCILVWKFSRFARNQDESTFYKGMLRKKLDIDVVSISEPVLDGMYGRLIEMIIEWQDEFYSYNLAQDVKRGMKTKARNGGYQARPPLGYRIPYHNAPPEIVPEEADIIRMIFRKYAKEGLSIFALTKYLNSLGLKTSRGKPFEKRSLEYILQNPAYAGYVRWNRTCNETKEIRDPSQWILEKGSHPAIISEELFQAAAERYESEHARKSAKHARPAESLKHWLGGMVKCPACGCSLSSCVRRKKTMEDSFTFQCYGYLKGKCSHNSYVQEDALTSAVLQALNQVTAYSKVQYEIRQADKKEEDSFQAGLLKTQLQKLSQKELRAKEAYMDGIDTKAEYRQNKLLLQEERQTLEAALAELEEPENEEAFNSPKETDAQMLARIRSVADILQSGDFSLTEKNNALKSIVDKIVFDRDNMHIDIYYYLSVRKPHVSDSDTGKSYEKP